MKKLSFGDTPLPVLQFSEFLVCTGSMQSPLEIDYHRYTIRTQNTLETISEINWFFWSDRWIRSKPTCTIYTHLVGRYTVAVVTIGPVYGKVRIIIRNSSS